MATTRIAWRLNGRGTTASIPYKIRSHPATAHHQKEIGRNWACNSIKEKKRNKIYIKKKNKKTKNKMKFFDFLFSNVQK